MNALPVNYPKDPLSNRQFRLELLEKAEKDPETQALLRAKCAADPLFFINSFCYTYDPRKTPSTIPFITYGYQDDYIKGLIRCIEEEIDSATEKSRDMGFSWMIVVLQLWSFLFKRYSSLYGSYKEDYVDSKGNMDAHFERIRYVLDRLPSWMKPGDLVDKYMNLSSQSLGADISGDTGQNFGTGGRRKFVIMDEFALWPFDLKAFRKTSDVTRCRIIGGTPEGRWNVYGKLMTNHKDYEHLAIEKFRLHWTQHPEKDLAWYAREKEKRTALDVAKELDISYDDSVTGAVYKSFTTLCKFGAYDYEPGRKLYTSWDFGRDTTAIIWIQKDFITDTCYVIDFYQNSDKDIDFYAPFLTGFALPGFVYSDEELSTIERHSAWRHSYAGHFGDPYNADSRSVLGENTIKKQLGKHGINIVTNRGSQLHDRINKTQLAFKRTFVNERLTDFIQAIVQSRYPNVPENSQATNEKLKPIHDENSHARTAFEYWFDNEPRAIAGAAKEIEEYTKKVVAKKLLPTSPSAHGGWKMG